MSALRPTTDGVVVIRPPEPGDPAILVAGRDAVFHRFLGPGAEIPRPTGCIVVDGETVGWVDYDVDRAWLRSGEVNVGYNVFAPIGARVRTRAVQLLMHHLAVAPGPGGHPAHPSRERPLAGPCDSNPVHGPRPPRRQPLVQATRAPARLHRRRGQHPPPTGRGPRHRVDLRRRRGPRRRRRLRRLRPSATEHVPRGEASISYFSHPELRGRGYASRAVRLVMQFLGDHTAALRCHLIVDADDRALYVWRPSELGPPSAGSPEAATP